MSKRPSPSPAPRTEAHKSAKPVSGGGRKRDSSLDSRIIEAALDILAEVGFDGMTMDAVAARAETGKASVYRRWSSKPELVRDALIQMSRTSVETEHLPDTGNLREDLLALLKPYPAGFRERKLKVLSGLGSFFSEHQELAEQALRGIYEPWTTANRCLMQRAISRGEISPQADLDTACQVMVAMTSCRAQSPYNSFITSDLTTVLDHLLLPALRHPAASGKTHGSRQP